MLITPTLRWPALAVALTVSAAAQAAQPATTAGAQLFKNNCAMCHTVTPDQASLAGPGLFNVVGRKIAGVPDFAYSKALKEAGAGDKRWTKAELELFLKDPAGYAPGSTMPVNVPKALDRAALVAYLASVKGAAVAGAAKVEKGADKVADKVADKAADKGSDRPGAAGGFKQEHWSDDKPGRIHEVRMADLPPPFASSSAGNGPTTVARPQNVLPSVPENFSVQLWTKDPDRGRLMVKAPNGDIFLSSPNGRTVKVLRSSNGEKADTVSVFASNLDRPYGIAFWPQGANPQYVYVAGVNSIVRFAYKNGDLKASGAPEVLVKHITDEPGGHTTRTLVFSADGKTMFLSVGSASNLAEGIGAKPPEPLAQWEAKHGLGMPWGDEFDRGAVLAYDPDGNNKRTFATGLRNCVGMVLYPTTGDLFCSVNERDMLGDNLPPDYLTRVKQGAFYGWPWYYIGANEEPRLKGHRPDLKAKVTAPDLLLTAHSAALGFVPYHAGAGAKAAFPQEYDGDMFIALHGSWNRHTRTGSKVVRALMKNGVPTGKYQDFVTGFVVSDKEVWGRPASVAVQNDGSLLVNDDLTGEIWRVAPK